MRIADREHDARPENAGRMHPGYKQRLASLM